MNIRPSFIAHHEWADSIADWGVQHNMELERQRDLQSEYTPDDRMEGMYTAPQGRAEQGWPMRRCSPEMAVWCPEDDDKREAMTGLDVAILMVGYMVSVLVAVGLFSLLANALDGWMQ